MKQSSTAKASAPVVAPVPRVKLQPTSAPLSKHAPASASYAPRSCSRFIYCV
ncbi:hypothetical protein [Lysobacter antibioticus]|uniref:hypothetical protein n=1 Tax=Lysobacter antibioticus TaxID=84531 RepID=UPI00034AEE2F|nr:hypothetical protein [Lysobacter antibioticus]